LALILQNELCTQSVIPVNTPQSKVADLHKAYDTNSYVEE